MTKEQLQGIRLKLEQGFMIERSEGWALLDEVTALRAEVEMLRGVGCMEDGDGPCGVCRKCAYRRGAEAMRESAVGVCEEAWVRAYVDADAWIECREICAKEIRALPVLEELT